MLFETDNPLHPGGIVKGEFIDAFEDYPGMTVGEAAALLGVSRVTLSRFLNERRPATLDLAMKLEAAGWGTADLWMELQMKWDIAQERKRLNRPRAAAPAVRRLQALETSQAEAAAA